jgi:hypothetical protein
VGLELSENKIFNIQSLVIKPDKHVYRLVSTPTLINLGHLKINFCCLFFSLIIKITASKNSFFSIEIFLSCFSYLSLFFNQYPTFWTELSSLLNLVLLPPNNHLSIHSQNPALHARNNFKFSPSKTCF